MVPGPDHHGDRDQGQRREGIVGRMATPDPAGSLVPIPGAGLILVTEAENLGLTNTTECLCGVGHRLP